MTGLLAFGLNEIKKRKRKEQIRKKNKGKVANVLQTAHKRRKTKEHMRDPRRRKEDLE